jgi:UDP-glucuronate decarboxylase
MVKSILVTGGSGFIGCHLCIELLKSGNIVYCIDNLSSGSFENIKGLTKNENFHFSEHDVEDYYHITEKIDEIYHLACPASPPFYQKDPIKTLDTNYFGTRNILELARIKKCKVLLTSTSEVYGDPQISPQSENYWGNVNPIGIRSCYDEGKRISETLMIEYERKYNIDIKIARIFNTYGPQMNKDDGRVVSNFINQMIYDKDITVYGNGNQTRCFNYVDDTVEGLILLMNTKGVRGPINIGNENEITINELLDVLQYLIPECKSDIIFKILPGDDPKQRKPDLKNAKELLMWKPKTELNDGLSKTIGYFEWLKNSV